MLWTEGLPRMDPLESLTAAASVTALVEGAGVVQRKTGMGIGTWYCLDIRYDA